MPQFAYKALQHDGVLTEGFLDASNRQEAMRQVEGRGLRPVKLSESNGAAPKKSAAKNGSAAKSSGSGATNLKYSAFEVKRSFGAASNRGPKKSTTPAWCSRS